MPMSGTTADPAANDTPENRQANRRIEIIVMPNIEELPKLDEPI